MSTYAARFTGITLLPDEYLQDFYPRFWNITTGDFWKLERRQSFQEQDNPSWDAAARGDWATALRLIDEREDALRAYYDRITRSGFTTYRVRVVGATLTPYLRWQLHSFRQRHRLGERIRVVSEADVVALEHHGTLPEIVTVGTDAVYEVYYDADGRLEGAVRSDEDTDRSSWQWLIQYLYRHGEDLDAFIDRNAAVLDLPLLAD